MTHTINNVTIPLVLSALKTIQNEIIDPVRSKTIVAFDNTPYTISAADMPLFVNKVGALTKTLYEGTDIDAREFNETRIYQMELYHSPYGSGVEGEKMGELTPYFDLVYNKFYSYPHLKQLAGVVDAKIINDSGATVLEYMPNQFYYGIRFVLQVTTHVHRLLGQNE